MKPRSTVAVLLAITESLLAARAKAARTKQARVSNLAPRTAKATGLLSARHPLIARIKAQGVS